MKAKKLIASFGITSLLISNLYALSPYVKGYKLYIRNIKHIPGAGMTAKELLKKLNIQTDEELENLFKDNGKELVEKTKAINPKISEGIQKIIKKGKLKYLKKFLEDTYYGKLPAGCGI